MPVIAAMLMVMAAFLCRVAAGAEAASDLPVPSIVWRVENAKDHHVALTGLSQGALKLLHAAKAADLPRLFAVQVEQEDPLRQLELPAIGGAYSVTAAGIEFRPGFPFERGVRYRASFRPEALTGLASKAKPQTQLFFQERAAIVRSTVVEHIFPSAAELPENLLKFYVHFSAAMSGGRIYDHIRLLDAQGQAVELPFLEIDEELWNPTMTRLTLFLDPGRIKREVRPLEEIGPALRSGQRYTLVLDSDWLDARGAALKARFEKAFTVVPPDRTPPDPLKWQVAAPAAGSRSALTVRFAEPMDHALALRLIAVRRADGSSVEGQPSLSQGEILWSFDPSLAWTAGRYALVTIKTIEDLAGNNIGKPFEVDLFDRVDDDLADEPSRIEFEVR